MVIFSGRIGLHVFSVNSTSRRAWEVVRSQDEHGMNLMPGAEARELGFAQRTTASTLVRLDSLSRRPWPPCGVGAAPPHLHGLQLSLLGPRQEAGKGKCAQVFCGRGGS